MSCWLCGHEKKDAHHLGCARIVLPDLTEAQAMGMGLIGRPKGKVEPPAPKVEVLKPGSMTTVPEDEEDETPAKGGETVEQCEYDGCTNPKFSASARAKYCAVHRDPKNRKE